MKKCFVSTCPYPVAGIGALAVGFIEFLEEAVDHPGSVGCFNGPLSSSTLEHGWGNFGLPYVAEL